MKETLTNVLRRLDEHIARENATLATREEFLLPEVIIRVLGQCSLFMHPDVDLDLYATNDLDALILSQSKHRSVWPIRKKFIELLADEKLEYDLDSEKVWLPPKSTYSTVYETSRILCEALDPLYSLCSKAIKAKEKNRPLIKAALARYGDALQDLIVRYGGEVEYFKK